MSMRLSFAAYLVKHLSNPLMQALMVSMSPHLSNSSGQRRAKVSMPKVSSKTSPSNSSSGFSLPLNNRPFLVETTEFS